MIELNRHIEILLLSNECVIVPDFGGFMTHLVPARYDAGDRSFLPPLRTLGFNPQLRMNDSVLVQSYVEAYDISYPEAIRQFAEEVEELKHILSEEGSYTLTDLGTLTVNSEGNYEFTPCEAGLLTPELYGLGSYTFKQLKDHRPIEEPLKAIPSVAREVRLEEPEKPVESQPTLLEFTDNTEENDGYTLHIRMSWIRNTVAVAAAIVAFFFMSTPVVNSDLGTRTMSHLQNNILYRLMPKDSNVIPAQPIVKTTIAQDADSVKSGLSSKSSSSSKTSASSSSSTSYLVIVASQVKLSNAEAYVEKLHKQGYEDAKVFISNNVVRVSCGEYETEAEAYRRVNRLSNKEEFYDAWVYKHSI